MKNIHSFIFKIDIEAMGFLFYLPKAEWNSPVWTMINSFLCLSRLSKKQSNFSPLSTIFCYHCGNRRYRARGANGLGKGESCPNATVIKLLWIWPWYKMQITAQNKESYLFMALWTNNAQNSLDGASDLNQHFLLQSGK